ncbi:MAG: solute carrier family 26 protein [Myxococcales bacterium]|nr:solute carrier family 26 protein [Myxococcales bacterium]
MPPTLTRFFPILRWLPGYRRENLRGDIIAGLTTAVMLIPQGMAYAMLAGLPPIVGLYASVTPLIAYALFGTSRELAVGPVAMDSLLVAAGVGAIAAAGSPEYIAYAVLLALMAGVLQIGMGLARLGFLVNFLSQPVISGFTSAAALIIGLSQLKHLIGVPLQASNLIHEIAREVGTHIGETHLLTVAIGAGAIVVLQLLKKLRPRFPRALAVVVITTLVVWIFRLDLQGVKIVGEVAAGLPSPALPEIKMEAVTELLPTALAIALVAFMEAISVSKAIATRKRYEVDANQELVAIGAANVAASLFRAYPVTGGFSRTAVNDQAGAQTPLAGLITAFVISIALLFFTPLLHFLPKATLAAIIMTAVFGLIDLKQVGHLWQVKRSDLALLGVTFAAVLAIGIQSGILVGVAASLLWFVVRTTRPHFAVLGRLPGTEVFRNVRHAPEAITYPGILILRIDAQFYFGNVSFLRSTLRELEAAAAEPLRAVVLDASAINNLDSSADGALHEIAAEYAERGITLVFAGVKGPVREVMARSGFIDRIGAGAFFLSDHDAIAALTGEGEPEMPADPLIGRLIERRDRAHHQGPTPTEAAQDPVPHAVANA